MKYCENAQGPLELPSAQWPIRFLGMGGREGMCGVLCSALWGEIEGHYGDGKSDHTNLLPIFKGFRLLGGERRCWCPGLCHIYGVSRQ